MKPFYFNVITNITMSFYKAKNIQMRKVGKNFIKNKFRGPIIGNSSVQTVNVPCTRTNL